MRRGLQAGPCAWLVILLCASAFADPLSEGSLRSFGTLRAMMHEGRIDAQITLDQLLPNAQLYGLGALAELDGELTILGGEAWLARPDDDGSVHLEHEAESDAGAALLVVSEVAAWQEAKLPRDLSFEELEAEIARLAAAAGFGEESEFAFLLEGEFDELQWHVIDGRRLPPGPSTHAAHRAAGLKEQRAKARGTLVGVYSPRAGGVFAHMGSKTHLHCVLEEPSASGHVDHVDLPAGTTIKFPVVHASPKG